MTSDDDELATYQEALLDVLARSHDDAAAARTALLARAPVTLMPYIADFDPRMLGLGIHLTEKWAKRC